MGKRPIIFGDGRQSRDFTFVDDVVQANVLAATRDEADGSVFSVATGVAKTVLELLGTIEGVIGVKLTPLYAPRTRR